jgi:hypothetical protein
LLTLEKKKIEGRNEENRDRKEEGEDLYRHGTGPFESDIPSFTLRG